MTVVDKSDIIPSVPCPNSCKTGTRPRLRAAMRDEPIAAGSGGRGTRKGRTIRRLL